MEGEEAGGDGELHALAEEAGEAWGERKRQNGREGVKVEDSNFRGFFLQKFMPRGAMSRGMDLSGTT